MLSDRPQSPPGFLPAEPLPRTRLGGRHQRSRAGRRTRHSATRMALRAVPALDDTRPIDVTVTDVVTSDPPYTHPPTNHNH